MLYHKLIGTGWSASNYADGSKFKDKWKHVVVFSLSKSDELAIEKLLKTLRTLELSSSILTKRGYGALNIRIYNKDLFTAIPSKRDTFHPTSPLAFVAGLFDGDGYVRMTGRETWRFSQASYPHLGYASPRNLVTVWTSDTDKILEAPWLAPDLQCRCFEESTTETAPNRIRSILHQGEISGRSSISGVAKLDI